MAWNRCKCRDFAGRETKIRKFLLVIFRRSYEVDASSRWGIGSPSHGEPGNHLLFRAAGKRQSPQLKHRNRHVVQVLPITRFEWAPSTSLRHLYRTTTVGGHLPDLIFPGPPRCEINPFPVMRPTGRYFTSGAAGQLPGGTARCVDDIKMGRTVTPRLKHNTVPIGRPAGKTAWCRLHVCKLA